MPAPRAPRLIAFTATLSVFFFAINMAKWLPYAWLGLLITRNMATSVVRLPLVPLGVMAGVRIAKRLNPVQFYRFIYGGIVLTGSKLVGHGFLAR